MNFVSITNNIIDINIIVNVSIGVVIGLSSAHLISKGISSLLQKTFPWIVKKILHKIQPVNITLGVRTDHSNPYDTEKVEINKYLYGNQRNPIKMYLSIQPEKLRWPSLYRNYSPVVIVNLYDKNDKINFSRNQRIEQYLWRITEYFLDIFRPNQITIEMQPKEEWVSLKNYEIEISALIDMKIFKQKFILNPSK